MDLEQLIASEQTYDGTFKNGANGVVSVKTIADGNSGSSVFGAAVWSRGCSPLSKVKSFKKSLNIDK